MFPPALKFAALLLILWRPAAAESIATIEYPQSGFNNDTGTYEVNILAVATLTNATINGYKIEELSGLAWDEDEHILYALSDNGYVLHLRPEFQDLRLSDVHFLAGHTLRDEKDKPLKYKMSDSEGIAIKNSNNGIKGDTQLLVSFERRPRLISYTPDGVMIAAIKLPGELSENSHYRGENKSLESVAIHPALGTIIGPEFPLAGQERGLMTLHTVDGKHYWEFPFYNPHDGALVDMTAMPDGSLLAMERVFGGIFPRLELTLHRIILNEEPPRSETVYHFESGNGLFNDNFEGITHFRENDYFMVSDDNNHPLRRTLLVYFSITEKPKP